jgi:endonuclease/exonuclease/phosphatase family metal-dependent hydrolase
VKFTNSSADSSRVQHATVLTWNLLAPVYNRQQPQESNKKEAWRPRLLKQLDLLTAAAIENGQGTAVVDVICLQEFWYTDTEYLQCWEEWSHAHSFALVACPRMQQKEDAVCILINTKTTRVDDKEAWEYNVGGQRVCLGLTCTMLETASPLLVFNTHLTFPHGHDAQRRIVQVEKLRAIVREQTKATQCNAVVCGDLNGDIKDDAVKRLFNKEHCAGCVIEPHTWEHGWVSHLSHNGNFLGCDFIATADDMASSRSISTHVHELLGHQDDMRVHGGRVSDHLPLVAHIHLALRSSS